jgi:hypothetical protein
MSSSTGLAALRLALRLVQRDVDGYPPPNAGDDQDGARAGEALPTRPGGAASGARLRLVGSELGVFVALPDGRFWAGGAGPLPTAAEGVEALVAVAARVQECFAEILWHSWPRCPDHPTVLRAEAAPANAVAGAAPAAATGVAPSGAAGTEEAVWRCDAEAGHTVAPVGSLAGSRP